MRSPCYNRFTTRSPSSARLCIALASTLCFSPLGVARADITSGEVQEILTILNHGLWSNDPDLNPVAEQLLQSQQDLGNGLGYFLTGYGGPDMDATSYTHKGTLPYMLQLQYAALTGGKLSASTPTTWNLRADTTEIVSLLRRLTNSVASSGSSSTSIVQVTTPISPDVLAGNPWWATNSAFVVSAENRVFAFPQDGEFSAGKFSFPEFMSAWSSRLSSPYSRQTPQRLQERDDWWGVSAFNPSASVADNIMRSYTWYDWIADYAKSNRVSSATFQADLLRELRALSNALSSASPSVDVTNHTYVFVTNLVSLSVQDVLAANPWWATNSAFAHDWLSYPLVYPDSSGSIVSFPQAFSVLLSTLLPDPVGFYPDNPDTWGGEWLRYGRGGQNQDSPSPYRPGMSWFDWTSEAMKSNIVLVTSYGMTTGTNDLLAVSQSTGAEDIIDTGDTTNTNVLDELTISRADTDAISGLTDTIDAEQVGDMFGELDVTPDPQLRIFPGAQYGDVTVDAVYADFSLPEDVATLISTAARWLWRILVMVSLFCIVRQEFDYWSTLGGSASA